MITLPPELPRLQGLFLQAPFLRVSRLLICCRIWTIISGRLYGNRWPDNENFHRGENAVFTLQELGDQIRAAREDLKQSQPELAAAITPPTNRSAVAHLEQGRRVASPKFSRGSVNSFRFQANTGSRLRTPKTSYA